MNQPLLEIKGVNGGYPGFQLKDISLAIRQGEIIGIIGPNGSGKTTLIKILTKVLAYTQGSISFQQKGIWEMKNKEFSLKVAVVSQNPGTSFLKVKDFVLLGRIPHFRSFQFWEHKNDILSMEKSLQLTGTEGLAGKWLGEISGGERQLVFIARALCQEPSLLVLDEPTTYLDISHQVKVMDLINRLNRQSGLTVIMALHDLNLASEYCHRLVLMDQGSIHKTGTPKEVLTYQTVEEIYQTIVIVAENPLSHRPYIFFVSEELKNKNHSAD